MSPTSLLDSDPAQLKLGPYPDFIGTWPRLTGRQEPEFESRHPGDESLGDKCAEFGRRIGLRCMPWEWQSLRGILSLQPANEWGERLWTHRDVTIECTRQQGKTLIIVLLILFHLFVLDTKRIVYTAQRWATALDVFNRVCTVIYRVPSLRKRLAEKPSKAGNRGVVKLTNGAMVEFGPRSQDFGRGYTEVDLYLSDESYDVVPAEESNLTGAQSAAQNPQTIYTSTPPVKDEHPNCQVLAEMHRLGFAGAPDLFYQLFAAPPGAADDDPETWRLAQPSYGVATNEREIRTKLQKAKTASQKALFAADYLGRGDYPPPETDFHAVFDEDGWNRMKDRAPKLTGQTAIALGRSPDRRTWVIGAGQRNGARVYLELGYSRMASVTDVVAAVVAVVQAWDPVAVVINHQSSAMEAVAPLTKAGIEPVVANSTMEQAACGGFLNAAIEGSLSHAGQQLLDTAVASAVKRELSGGRFVWDLDADSSSAHLDAATLAHWALVTYATEPKKLPQAPVVSAAGALERDGDEVDFMAMKF
jgi:phage terminase large subunit-like protein